MSHDRTDNVASTAAAPLPGRATLMGHLSIARIDHWVKNVFVLPGCAVAIAADRSTLDAHAVYAMAVGIFATCLVASSNYTINEVLDAPFDRKHPVKRNRPVPAGRVNIPLAYVQWILLGVAGVALGYTIATALAVVLAALWVMGCVYNIAPVRSKDVPYLDVLSEAVNNPLRMLAGWYMIRPNSVVPASLLLSYWMVGSYFMAIKRYAELRGIGDRAVAAAYRKSFAHYTSERLLVSIMFYGSAAMLFFGAFIMRYRIEMILAFPLVAWVMAVYLSMGFREDSAAQAPEKLHKEPYLMAAVVLCAVLVTALMFVRIPAMHAVFAPTLPVSP